MYMHMKNMVMHRSWKNAPSICHGRLLFGIMTGKGFLRMRKHRRYKNLDKEVQNEPVKDTGRYDVSGIGTVKISEDVVGVIAGIAASEIEGVSGLNPTTTGGITQVFTGKRNVTKGVKVNIGETDAVIDMVMSVEYGYNIPSVVKQVQAIVAETVENITGLKVAEVNIMVNNISVRKADAQGKDGK